MGSVKRQGAVKKGNGESDEKGEQKPHIQFICTAPLYSTRVQLTLSPSFFIIPVSPHSLLFFTLWSIHFMIPNTSHLSVRKPSIQLLYIIFDNVYGSHVFLTVKNQRPEKRRECGETGIVKKEGGSVKRRESVTIRESNSLHIPPRC
jgi:hypothetical protein